MKLDFFNLCQQNNITPNGIIWIGAYDGKTLKRLNLPNTVKTLLIDANPNAVERLQTNFAESPNIQVVQAAISNHNDAVTLHLTSLESSSSILPWKQYSEIYPNIKEIQQLTLPSLTLDTLLEQLNLSPTDFNILILDIQGAEFLALEGASQLLNTLDGIYTSIYYQELFEGCALAEQVDQFLSDYQFQRVAEGSPYHPSWGEAFYVRQAVTIDDKVSPIQSLSETAQLLQETQQELETLHSQYQEVLEMLEKSKTELKNSTENLTELQSQRDEILAELEQSQSQLQQLQSQLEQTQTELEQSQSQKQQLQTQLEQTQTELEKSQSQLQNRTENLAELQSERDEILAELEQSQSQQQQLQSQLQQSQTELEQSQSQQQQLQSQLKQTQTELEQSQSQKQQLQSQLEQSQSQLQNSQIEHKQTQTQLEKTQKESDQSRSELHEVREELELTQFQLDEVQVELEQYVAQFHQQKEEITQLKSELEKAKTQLTQVQYQPEIVVSKKSKSDNAAIVKLLARVLAETLED
ncbi:MAG: FkbM family methyltransferase [Planktothrix sp.]